MFVCPRFRDTSAFHKKPKNQKNILTGFEDRLLVGTNDIKLNRKFKKQPYRIYCGVVHCMHPVMSVSLLLLVKKQAFICFGPNYVKFTITALPPIKLLHCCRLKAGLQTAPPYQSNTAHCKTFKGLVSSGRLWMDSCFLWRRQPCFMAPWFCSGIVKKNYLDTIAITHRSGCPTFRCRNPVFFCRHTYVVFSIVQHILKVNKEYYSTNMWNKWIQKTKNKKKKPLK